MLQYLSKRKNQKGFTVIELIVVIAVIAILVGVGIPRFTGHTEEAKMTKLLHDGRLLEDAVSRYYMDHGDWPRLNDEGVTMNDLVKQPGVIILNAQGNPESFEEEVNLYQLDMEKMKNYVRTKSNGDNFVLQNPVGSVYTLDPKTNPFLAPTGPSITEVTPVITMTPGDQGLTTTTEIQFSHTGTILPEGIDMAKVTVEWEGVQSVYGTEGEYTVRLRLGHAGEFSPWTEKSFYVIEVTSVVQIAAGGNHTVALMNDGTVKAWGYNGSGQLGDGTTTQRTTPITVSGLYGVKQIAPGGHHAFALLEDGTVKAWGANYYGQLGDGTTTNRSTPIKVIGLD